jgi:hypothetical protein
MARLAAGCGDDDSGGGDTTTTAAAETTTTAEGGEATTTAAEDGGAEAATEITIGEDGRLQPITECVGENVASEDGSVTETTVNVAALNYDVKPLADIGFSASDRSFTETMATFLEGATPDGVCGRMLDVQRVEYDVIRGEFGQACIQVTEDRRNLAVVSVASQNSTCITDAGTVVITGGDWTEEGIAATNGLLFNRNPSADDAYRATLQWAETSGQLGGKVGVFYGGIDELATRAMEAIIQPTLDELGVDYTAYRTDYSGPSDPQGNTVILAAASDFAAQGVDTVLSFVQNTNIVALQLELDAQGARPQFISFPIGGNTANTLFAKNFGAVERARRPRPHHRLVPRRVDRDHRRGGRARHVRLRHRDVRLHHRRPVDRRHVGSGWRAERGDTRRSARDPAGARVAAVPRRRGVDAGEPPRRHRVHGADLPGRHRDPRELGRDLRGGTLIVSGSAG